MEFLGNVLTYEIYYKLRESVGWKNFSPAQAESALDNSAYDIIAKDADKVIGMARLIGDGLYYLIVDVIVIPEKQGQGIGTKMIDLLIEHIRDEMPEQSKVSVQLIAEKGKEGFYRNLGFKELPHEYCGAGMRKGLLKE
ncbi:MAG: GNAT family N-acetyltransferase [Eubacterium sp.]